MQLLPGGGRGDVCVHWGLRGISTSSGSSTLSARRCLRARRSDFSAQMKKKMIAARIAKSTAAESQYFSSGFDASLLMTSHWFEPLGTCGPGAACRGTACASLYVLRGRSSSRQSRSTRRASAPWPCFASERPSSFC